MNLYAKRIVDNHGVVQWLLFWEGEISKPVAVLTDLAMQRLVKIVQEDSKLPLPTIRKEGD